jgi:hypothetical protein
VSATRVWLGGSRGRSRDAGARNGGADDEDACTHDVQLLPPPRIQPSARFNIGSHAHAGKDYRVAVAINRLLATISGLFHLTFGK